MELSTVVNEGRHFLPTQHARSWRMRKRSSRSTGAAARTYWSCRERGSVYYRRERARQDANSVAARTDSPVYRRSLLRAWWLLFLVTRSSYHGAYTFPASQGVVPLVAHTHPAILVLLPKLTNAPTKLHTGCIAPWGSGVCLYTLSIIM